MRILICISVILCSVSCASPEKRYQKFSTSQLQLKRQQLAESIPDMEFSFGPFGPNSEGKKNEKSEIEMELLRRFEAGDKAAELKALPERSGPKVRGGR